MYYIKQYTHKIRKNGDVQGIAYTTNQGILLSIVNTTINQKGGVKGFSDTDISLARLTLKGLMFCMVGQGVEHTDDDYR